MKSMLKFSRSWYFGWNVVAVASILTLLTVGVRVGVGPLFFSIVRDLEISRTSLSSIVALSMLIYGLTMPLAGWLVTRYSTRWILLFGSILILIGGLSSARAYDSAIFTITFGVILSVGLGLVSPVSMTPLLTHWFNRRRSMALLYLSTGSMAGFALITPIFGWSSDYIGWRDTLFIFFLIYATIALPGIYFIMKDHQISGEKKEKFNGMKMDSERVDGNDDGTTVGVGYSISQALRTRPFWVITLGLSANGFSMTLLGVHGVPMLVDHGLRAQSGALGIGFIGVTAIFSTIAVGRIADLIPYRYLLSAIYGVRGLAFIALLLISSDLGLYFVAVISGLVWAGAMAVASAMLGAMYGLEKLGVLYGISFLFQQLAGMVSAWLGGWGFEMFGTHWLSFGFAAALLLISSIFTANIS